jgi:choline kinase/thiamine kinase-like enzyme
MNTPTICLLTAGKGSRMGQMGQLLNKSLFPINGKAIISRIIESFPKESEFIIGLGHLGHQVREYLRIAHPEVKFIFQEIDKFEGPGTGPGYSLLCCERQLQKPFYFVSCDTLWTNTIDWNSNENWMGVDSVDPSISARYCNVKITGNKAIALIDKVRIPDSSYQTFIGLCFIKDYSIFWTALKNKAAIAGEHQISSGIQGLVELDKMSVKQLQWTDVGDAEKFKTAVSQYENFDFSKQNETLYIINRKVIKFFADIRITEKRVIKSKLNPEVFPEITDHAGQFYAYAFQPGETLYAVNRDSTFKNLLEWLNKKLWQPRDVSAEIMRSTCLKFYKDKTMERLELYHEKYPGTGGASQVNGKYVPSTEELLEQIPWTHLSEGVPRFIHGDLQFDNIIFDEETGIFKLLDWRQDFAGQIEFGDLYYDLAKLYGGIILNYDYIKLNLLSYREDKEGISFDFAQRFKTESYLQMLSSYITKNGYDLDKVRLLVPLIYLNMSPLHHFPFDKMLYSLGRQMLHQELTRIKLGGN